MAARVISILATFAIVAAMVAPALAQSSGGSAGGGFRSGSAFRRFFLLRSRGAGGRFCRFRARSAGWRFLLGLGGGLGFGFFLRRMLGGFRFAPRSDGSFWCWGGNGAHVFARLEEELLLFFLGEFAVGNRASEPGGEEEDAERELPA